MPRQVNLLQTQRLFKELRIVVTGYATPSGPLLWTTGCEMPEVLHPLNEVVLLGLSPGSVAATCLHESVGHNPNVSFNQNLDVGINQHSLVQPDPGSCSSGSQAQFSCERL